MAQRLPDPSSEILDLSLRVVQSLLQSLPTETDLAQLAERVSADLAGGIETWLKGPAADESSEPLTPREITIARLVAAGLTNPQIARELHVSRATVSTHVAHVLAKLGYSSRAQVAAWMARREPSIRRPA